MLGIQRPAGIRLVKGKAALFGAARWACTVLVYLGMIEGLMSFARMAAASRVAE